MLTVIQATRAAPKPKPNERAYADRSTPVRYVARDFATPPSTGVVVVPAPLTRAAWQRAARAYYRAWREEPCAWRPQ